MRPAHLVTLYHSSYYHSLDFTRIFDLLQYQAYKFPLKKALTSKIGSQWKSWSTEECLNLANRLSAGLLHHKLIPAEKVALIFSANRPEWLIFDMAITQIGAIDVPIYPTISDRELCYILNETAAAFIVLSDARIYQRISGLRDQLHHIKTIISLEKMDGVIYWNELLLTSSPADIMEVMDHNKKVEPRQVATILYTSGTTGDPKGVMLTHQNIISNVKSCLAFMPMNHGERVMSVLPLSHIFERMVNYLYLAGGIEIYYGQSLESLRNDIRDIKPHYFTAVPRMLEKIYEKFLAVGSRLPGWRKKYFLATLEKAKNYHPDQKYGWQQRLSFWLAHRLIFSKWRQALGGEIKGIVVGAAALSPVLNRIFSAAGIMVREGYGLTESSPVIAFNRFEPGGARIGSVGIPIPGIELRISDENEILVKGPNITPGYYLKPSLTREVIDEEGWFSTGDLGSFDGKFLFIIGRKKELFKTSGGKYISPQPLEKKILEDEMANQAIVIGSNRRFAAALIVPDFNQLERLLIANDLSISHKDQIIRHPAVLAHFESLIEQINQELGQYEKIKKFRLLSEEWTPDSGELTPTMKMRRHIIEKNFEGTIEEMYR